MTKWLRAVLLFSSIFTIQACAPKAQEDCGFVLNVYGERISWKTNAPVKMYIHESVPQSFIPAILAAAETWEKTAGRKLIDIDTSRRIQGPANPHQDGFNVIYMLDTWEPTRDTEQGRTSMYWLGDLIKEADIRINAKNFGYYWQNQTLTKATANQQSKPVNIEALVLHELGHVLGLKHKDEGGSVMATYLASGADRVQVADTDAASLRCEY
jgi:hypothetical protein